jgi:hypothetical protein
MQIRGMQEANQEIEKGNTINQVNLTNLTKPPEENCIILLNKWEDTNVIQYGTTSVNDGFTFMYIL